MDVDGTFNGGFAAFSQERITPGFVESLRVWGQLISGARSEGWSSVAARQIMREAGLSDLPRRAPTREEISAFILIAKLNSLPTLLDRLALNNETLDKTATASKTCADYLKDACKLIMRKQPSDTPAKPPRLGDMIANLHDGNLDLPSLDTLTEDYALSQDANYWDTVPDDNDRDPADLRGRFPEGATIAFEAAEPPPSETEWETRFGDPRFE